MAKTFLFPRKPKWTTSGVPMGNGSTNMYEIHENLLKHHEIYWNMSCFSTCYDDIFIQRIFFGHFNFVSAMFTKCFRKISSMFPKPFCILADRNNILGTWSLLPVGNLYTFLIHLIVCIIPIAIMYSSPFLLQLNVSQEEVMEQMP